jgi:hypothetical protein
MRHAFSVFLGAVLASSICSFSAAASEPYVRLNDLPAMVPAVNALRDADILVDIWRDSDPHASTSKEDYAVISIGARVPAPFAINVLRRALPLMPWLKYVFIQDDPKYADLVHLSGHVDWVPFKKLRALTRQDFEKILRKGQTDQEFRHLIRSFSGVEAASKP